MTRDESAFCFAHAISNGQGLLFGNNENAPITFKIKYTHYEESILVMKLNKNNFQ